MSIHPQTIVTYHVYYGGEENNMLGIVEAELPNIQSMTQEMKGAGLAGTIDVPVIGHSQAMTCKFTWRTATDDIKKLIPQVPHELELYAGVQSLDDTVAKFELTKQKITMLVIPKGINLGKLATAELQNVETEFSVYQLKWWFGNTMLCDIDILNGKFEVGGIDKYAEVIALFQ